MTSAANISSNPLLLGDLDREESGNFTDDDPDENDEQFPESTRRDEYDDENDYYVTANDDDDGELAGTSQLLANPVFQLPDPKEAMELIRAKHNLEDFQGDKLSATWSPAPTVQNSLGSLKPLPPPPSEKNKLTPLAATKLISKSENLITHRSLPKSVALERQLDENKVNNNLSTVFSLEPNVVNTKNSFTNASILPPISSSSTSVSPQPSPRKDEPQNLDSSRERPALPAINQSNSSSVSPANQNEDDITVDSREEKACRELKRLYKKCKESNDYRKFHNFVEDLFSSFGSVAKYFKSSKTTDIYDESSLVDLTLLYTFCDIIDRFPLDDTIRKILLRDIVNILMSPPQQETMLKSDLQTYFILMHLPIFAELNTYVVYSYLIRQVATLKPQNTHQLIQFFNKAGEVSIKNVSKMLRKFVDKRFFPPSEDALPPSKDCSWWIPSACKCLAVLFAANANANSQPHLEIRQFYCRSMDSLELLEDFQSWNTGVPKRSFTFCQYSFVITTFAKRRLLSQANELEMLTHAKENLVAKARNGRPAEPINAETALFVEFSVRRTNILQDSVKEIVAKQKELKRKLRVSFVGEEGVDLGGLTKEWFLLLAPRIFGLELGLFVKTSSKMLWFNGACKGCEAEFFLAGAILGLAIYNSIILDVALPVCCFKKLLSPPLSPPKNANIALGGYTFPIHDFAELEPEMAKHLSDLMRYSGDVQSDFGLDFTVTVQEFDATKNYTLKKNGYKHKVTNQNKLEYVSRLIGFKLNEYIQSQFSAFYRGFHSVCNSDVLSILRAEELQSIICGEPILEVKVLRRSSKYENCSSKDELIVNLWQVVEEMKPKLQKKFLWFLTGSEKIPIGGSKDLRLIIRKVDTPLDNLPVAHTCFNELHLPPYTTKEQLKDKLTFAINNTQGFNLK